MPLDRPWQPKPGTRLLVVAPHPDDEALAAAGLVWQVQQSGGAAAVVYLTDGDGYADGVRAWRGRESLRAEDFRAYGAQRRVEARDAGRHLGLAPNHIWFLGFPDSGLLELWAHWSRKAPYCSPYTGRCASSPVGANISPYAGEELVSAISAILQRWRPDLVLLPDPRDLHPDHCNGGLYGALAWKKLALSSSRSPQVLTYLVHSPEYPGASGWLAAVRAAGVCGSRVGPAEVSRTPWVYLPLPPEAIAAKRAALAEYRTQMGVMADFLSHFVRPAEVFAQWSPNQLLAAIAWIRGRVSLGSDSTSPAIVVPHPRP